MAIDKFNGNLGNVNNFLFGGKKVEKEETKKTAPKENVPVGKPEAAAKTVNVADIQGKPISEIWGLYKLEEAKKVDTSDKAVAARAAQFFKAEPNIYALKDVSGIPPEIEGIDDDIAALLSPKERSFVAQVPPEQVGRISLGTVSEFDRMVALQPLQV